MIQKSTSKTQINVRKHVLKAHCSRYIDPPSSRAWWRPRLCIHQAPAPWHELPCRGSPQEATGMELSKNARETTSCWIARIEARWQCTTSWSLGAAPTTSTLEQQYCFDKAIARALGAWIRSPIRHGVRVDPPSLMVLYGVGSVRRTMPKSSLKQIYVLVQ